MFSRLKKLPAETVGSLSITYLGQTRDLCDLGLRLLLPPLPLPLPLQFVQYSALSV